MFLLEVKNGRDYGYDRGNAQCYSAESSTHSHNYGASLLISITDPLYFLFLFFLCLLLPFFAANFSRSLSLSLTRMHLCTHLIHTQTSTPLSSPSPSSPEGNPRHKAESGTKSQEQTQKETERKCNHLTTTTALFPLFLARRQIASFSI